MAVESVAIEVVYGAIGAMAGMVSTIMAVAKVHAAIDSRLKALETSALEHADFRDWLKTNTNRTTALEIQVTHLAARQDSHAEALSRIEAKLDRLFDVMQGLLCSVPPPPR